jgi:hypothetical protein
MKEKTYFLDKVTFCQTNDFIISKTEENTSKSIWGVRQEKIETNGMRIHLSKG